MSITISSLLTSLFPSALLSISQHQRDDCFFRMIPLLPPPFLKQLLLPHSSGCRSEVHCRKSLDPLPMLFSKCWWASLLQGHLNGSSSTWWPPQLPCPSLPSCSPVCPGAIPPHGQDSAFPLVEVCVVPTCPFWTKKLPLKSHFALCASKLKYPQDGCSVLVKAGKETDSVTCSL